MVGCARENLLVTSHTPALGSGRALRTYAVTRAIAQHRGLDLLYPRFGAAEPDAAFRAIPGVEFFPVSASRGARRIRSYAGARASGVPQGFARGISPELVDRAAELVRSDDRGRVIADGPTAAALLMRLARERPVIYNAHNVESLFRSEIEGLGSRGTRALRAFERRVLARASESWMVSQADLRAARELCPDARLRYVPNVVDAAAITPVGAPPADSRAIFVGSFDYEPNRDALRFLVDDVLPRVWRELPEARVSVVGGGLDEPPSADPRVEALGFVENLGAAYASARCAVVPLQLGGGTPLKLLEALAYGLPVVATRRAAGGLELTDGEHCLIANDSEGFALATLSLLRGEHPGLGARGRALVLERYSIDALAELLTD